MGLELDVDCERFGEVGVMKRVGGAMVRREESPKGEGCFVLPMVINEGERANTLSPKPKLSVDLSDWGWFEMATGSEEECLKESAFVWV